MMMIIDECCRDIYFSSNRIEKGMNNVQNERTKKKDDDDDIWLLSMFSKPLETIELFLLSGSDFHIFWSADTDIFFGGKDGIIPNTGFSGRQNDKVIFWFEKKRETDFISPIFKKWNCGA